MITVIEQDDAAEIAGQRPHHEWGEGSDSKLPSVFVIFNESTLAMYLAGLLSLDLRSVKDI